jgi:hypothetical protein
MMKDKEMNDGAPIETTVAGNLEEIIDVEVARIAADRRSDSGGLTDADGGCDKSSCDAEEGREEVLFWHVFVVSYSILIFC